MMKTLRLIVGCLAIAIGISDAQEMSAEWYRQKEASWERAKQDFPQSAYPGPFKTRMLEIDEWAKANNPDLYYSSSKPYLLARMVQQERDKSLAAEQQAARERLRTSGYSQTREPPTTSTQRSNSEMPLEKLFENDSKLSAIIKRHNSPNTAAIWIGAAIIIILTFGAAWGLYWIIWPRHGVVSASSLGRKWAAWTVAIVTISMLPSFFRKLDGNSLALWAIGVFGWGVIAFVIGWSVGLFKFRQKGGQDSSPPAPPPSLQQEIGDESDKISNVEKAPQGQLQDDTNHGHSTSKESQNHQPPPIMNNNEFELEIPEGTIIGNGYVEMRHNTQYSLNLKNHRRVPCDAEVTIDGIHVGTWRVDVLSEIRIERPVHDTGHFTFFEVVTKEADMAGIAKNSDNGLISVTFKPQKESFGLNASPLPGPEYSAGATGLSGVSQQRFRDALEIEHDMARAFTIHLRLISRRPDIRPLAPRSTPIPPPVG